MQARIKLVGWTQKSGYYLCTIHNTLLHIYAVRLFGGKMFMQGISQKWGRKNVFIVISFEIKCFSIKISSC